ncbi:hypothetical protein F4823DRAFT_570138 [Ustulina deusta]|nr:hypothetical protein F4823DRAFT_570138 [Ustulina deusta]
MANPCLRILICMWHLSCYIIPAILVSAFLRLACHGASPVGAVGSILAGHMVVDERGRDNRRR